MTTVPGNVRCNKCQKTNVLQLQGRLLIRRRAKNKSSAFGQQCLRSLKRFSYFVLQHKEIPLNLKCRYLLCRLDRSSGGGSTLTLNVERHLTTFKQIIWRAMTIRKLSNAQRCCKREHQHCFPISTWTNTFYIRPHGLINQTRLLCEVPSCLCSKAGRYFNPNSGSW